MAFGEVETWRPVVEGEHRAGALGVRSLEAKKRTVPMPPKQSVTCEEQLGHVARRDDLREGLNIRNEAAEEDGCGCGGDGEAPRHEEHQNEGPLEVDEEERDEVLQQSLGEGHGKFEAQLGGEVGDGRVEAFGGSGVASWLGER